MSAHRSLRRNLVALYAVQLSGYLIPLLTIPWLTHVLGPHAFGRLGFCTAVTSYFVLLADYGFNLSATRAIAVHGNDSGARSKIFWNTMTVKGLLAALGFVTMIALTYVASPLGAQRTLLMLSYLTVLGTVLTPTWFFMGSERQATLSAITIGVRVLAVPLTFLLVHGPLDLPKAIAISGASPVAAGLASLGLLACERALRRCAITGSDLLDTFKDGWHLFLSNASMSLYTSSNTVLLGLVAGTSAVGYYTPAERLIQATQGLLTPINQSVYPRVARLMHDSRSDAFILIRKLLWVLGTGALALSIFVFVAAPYLVSVLFGVAYEPAVSVLRWLSPLPFVVGLSNVFGIHTMLPLGMKRMFSRIVLLAGALNLIALVLMARWFGAAGAAAAVLATEIFVTLVMGIKLWRRDVPIFGRPAVV